MLHHQPHLYDHRADGSEFTLSFLDPGATEPEQFGHELRDGKVDTWDPRALGEHRNDHLVRTQGEPCIAAGVLSIWGWWSRVALVPVFLCSRAVAHPMILSLQSKG